MHWFSLLSLKLSNHKLAQYFVGDHLTADTVHNPRPVRQTKLSK